MSTLLTLRRRCYERVGKCRGALPAVTARFVALRAPCSRAAGGPARRRGTGRAGGPLLVAPAGLLRARIRAAVPYGLRAFATRGENPPLSPPCSWKRVSFPPTSPQGVKLVGTFLNCPDPPCPIPTLPRLTLVAVVPQKNLVVNPQFHKKILLKRHEKTSDIATRR